MSDDDRKQIRDAFADAVNMTPKELSDWLATEQARSVGDTGGDGESTGHAMGRRILDLKGAKVGDLDDDDHRAMNKVVGYVHRHLRQGGPSTSDVATSKWRYSLMNWGHDPLKGS